jgi:hypothetical protein
MTVRGKVIDRMTGATQAAFRSVRLDCEIGVGSV